MPASKINYNDEVEVLINVGTSLVVKEWGKFKQQDDRYMRITATAGENMGKDVFIPVDRVVKVVIMQRAREVHE